MTPIRLGIIGAGSFANSPHRAAMEAQPDRFEIVAAYDGSPSASLDWASRLRAAAYESLDDLLAHRQIEAVFITGGPVSGRFEAARQALEAGRHVIVEPPMAASAAQCDQLIPLARRKGLALTAAHVRRWDNALVHARRRIDGGELGDVALVKLATAVGSLEDGPFGEGFDLFDAALLFNATELVDVAAAPSLRHGSPSHALTVLCRFEAPPAVEITVIVAAASAPLALPRMLAVGARSTLSDNSAAAAPTTGPFYEGVWRSIRERAPVPVLAAAARNAVYLAECAQVSARRGQAVVAERLLKAVE
ncbi:hypothetical protein CMK11_15425 [Candidatus Poribacteria bacterium]|nr:hypothetical protein [Candidatus Poribacteria bacterium]